MSNTETTMTHMVTINHIHFPKYITGVYVRVKMIFSKCSILTLDKVVGSKSKL